MVLRQVRWGSNVNFPCFDFLFVIILKLSLSPVKTRLGWRWKFSISMSCWSSTICWIIPYFTSPPCPQIYLMLMVLNPTQGGEREKPKDSLLMLNLRPTEESFYQSTIGHQDYGRKFFLWNRHIGIQDTIDHFTVESSQTLCDSLRQKVVESDKGLYKGQKWLIAKLTSTEDLQIFGGTCQNHQRYW